MDNFTLAVVVGIGAVLATLGLLIVVDKGPPETVAQSPKKKS
jgi:hypothetical protein